MPHIHVRVVAARFAVARALCSCASWLCTQRAASSNRIFARALPGFSVSTEHLPRPEVVTLGLYGNPRRRPPTFATRALTAAAGSKPALNTSSQRSGPLRAGLPHPQPQRDTLPREEQALPVGALVGRPGFRAGFARIRARGRGRGSVGAACSSRKKPLDLQSSYHLIYSLARPPRCAAAPCSPAYCVSQRHGVQMMAQQAARRRSR